MPLLRPLRGTLNLAAVGLRLRSHGKPWRPLACDCGRMANHGAVVLRWGAMRYCARCRQPTAVDVFCHATAVAGRMPRRHR